MRKNAIIAALQFTLALAMASGTVFLYVDSGSRAGLYANGTRTVGSVTWVNIGVRVSGIDYTYAFGGKAYPCHRGRVFDACVSGYKVGDPIDVWVDPAAPARSVCEAERCVVTGGWRYYAGICALGAILLGVFGVLKLRAKKI